MCGCTYINCTLTLIYFCVSSVFNHVPNFTKQNPLILIITCIAGEVKTKNNYQIYISIQVNGNMLFVSYKPYVTVFTGIFIVH